METYHGDPAQMKTQDYEQSRNKCTDLLWADKAKNPL